MISRGVCVYDTLMALLLPLQVYLSLSLSVGGREGKTIV